MGSGLASRLGILVPVVLLLASCLPSPAATPSGALEPEVATPKATLPETSQSGGETLPAPAQRTFVDGLGRTVTFEGIPRRIVSLAPSNTEILFAVGAGAQVVGRDELSDYPEEATALTSVGGPWGEFDAETIVALQPDLVLAAGINTPEQVQLLEGLGLRVYYLANPLDFDGLFENLLLMGDLTGHAAEAEALVASLRSRLAEVQGAAVADPPSVYYEVDATDPNAPWTVGSGTFQEILIEVAGGRNVFDDLEGWVQVSAEEVITRDPDVILFAAGPYVPVSVEAILERPGWEQIEAVTEGRVHGIDTNWVDRPGPRLVDALEAVAEILRSVGAP